MHTWRVHGQQKGPQSAEFRILRRDWWLVGTILFVELMVKHGAPLLERAAHTPSSARRELRSLPSEARSRASHTQRSFALWQ